MGERSGFLMLSAPMLTTADEARRHSARWKAVANPSRTAWRSTHCDRCRSDHVVKERVGIILCPNLNERRTVGPGYIKRGLHDACRVAGGAAGAVWAAALPAIGRRSQHRCGDHLQSSLPWSSPRRVGMGVCTDHVFDVRVGIEARDVSVVVTANLPISGYRVTLHEKSVGIRPRRCSQRSVSVHIILDIAAHCGVSATAKTGIRYVQTADWQCDVLIGECCRRRVAHFFANLEHLRLSPAGGEPLCGLVNSNSAAQCGCRLRTTGAFDGAYRVLDVPVLGVVIGKRGHLYSDNGRIIGISCSHGGNQIESCLMKSGVPI